MAAGPEAPPIRHGVRLAVTPALLLLVFLMAFAGSAEAGSSLAATSAAATSAPSAAGNPARLTSQARALMARGRQREALRLADRIASMYARADDASGLAATDLLRSDAWRALGDEERARAAARRARARARVLGEPLLEARALVHLAAVASDRGDRGRAAALLNRAQPLAERGGDPGVRAALLEAQARNERTLGLTAASTLDHTRALEQAKRAGRIDLQIRALGGRATTYMGMGRFDAALADEQAAYRLARGPTEPRLKAQAAFGLAQAEAHLWNLDRAEALWTEAIDQYRQAGFRLGVALARKQRMDTRFAMGDLEGAADDGTAALASLDAMGSAAELPALLARLALVEAVRGDRGAVDRYSVRAEATAGERPLRRFVENDLAMTALRSGRPDEAAPRFARVLAIARKLGDREYEWRARYGLGRVAFAEHRLGDAEAELRRAVGLIERMRRELPESDERATFMSDRASAYAALIAVLEARSSAPGDRFAREALETAERGRSRALADLLAESRAFATDPRLAGIRLREVRASRRLSDLQKRILATADPAARRGLLEALRQAELDYDALVVRIRRENPAWAALELPVPASASTIAAMLGADETLVEFAFTPDGGFAWALRGGRLLSYRIPRQDGLAEEVTVLRALMRAGDGEGVRQLGARMYRRLLGPAAPLLPPGGRLIIVGVGPLLRLPFAALTTPAGRWLIDAHPLALAPSATVLGELRQRPRHPTPRPLIAFAAPHGVAGRAAGLLGPAALDGRGLTGAGAEVRDIARLIGTGSTTLTGPAATEARLKREDVAGYRVVHFATHAVVDEMVPRRSAILLAAGAGQDGLLQLNEIQDLRLNAALAVLAGCRTELGRLVRGEGLLSLSRAFMQAGARGVLASLWEVDDAGTRRLMRDFYEGLRAGQAPDAALREAQRKLIEGGGPAAQPEAWAAFVLTGDVRDPVFSPASRRPRHGALLGAALGGFLLIVVLGGLGISRRSKLPSIPSRSGTEGTSGR